MNKNKSLAYIQEWNELERAHRNLDFERSVWARRVRSEYPTGVLGDKQFAGWCVTELELTKRQIDELLLRATAAEIIADRDEWKRIGGFGRIKYLDEFPRQDQATVLKAVKTTGKTIQSVVAERGLRPAIARTDTRHDAATLAMFVRSLKLKLPPAIEEIVGRYERDRDRVAAVVERHQRDSRRVGHDHERDRVAAVVERHQRERGRGAAAIDGQHARARRS